MNADIGIGSDVARVDGRAKVTGFSRYTFDNAPEAALQAVLLAAEIGKGRIRSIDISAAEKAVGVHLVLTRGTMQPLGLSKFYMSGGHSFQSLQPLQTDEIAYRGQTVAVVVAETLERAEYAKSLIRVEFDETVVQPTLDADESADIRQAEAIPLPMVADKAVGDADGELSKCAVTIDQRYETPPQHHNPLELISVVAQWDGDRLTIWTTAQSAEAVRQGVAIQLAMDPENVRVISPLIGGGFGQKAALGPHVAMAAVAARRLRRPVRLELRRAHIFHEASFRAATRQRIRLGATPDGAIRAAIQETRSQTSQHDLMPGLGTDVTSRLYGIENFRGEERLVRRDTQTPGFMRAPFEMAAVFGFESAIDELAYKLGHDPLAFRLRNDASRDPITGKPFSSRHLAACLQRGAERFNWGRRSPAPSSMRAADGALVGMGVAVGAYKAATAPTRARVRFNDDGFVDVSVAAHEMGQGISTAISLAIADRLGVDLESIRLIIGDTVAPPQHLTAGSWGTATVVPAVVEAAEKLRAEILSLACTTQGGPIYGASQNDVLLRGGHAVAADGRTESVIAVLRRLDRRWVEGETVRLAPGQNQQSWDRAVSGLTAPVGPVYPDFVAFSFAAHFAEVHIQPTTRQVRVERMVSVVDCGKVVSRRTACSQVTGGLVWGIGAALFEASEVDDRYGGFLNANLADYIVPSNADIGNLDVTFIDEPDP